MNAAKSTLARRARRLPTKSTKNPYPNEFDSSPLSRIANTSALIATLHRIEQRLEELTDGEVDTVAGCDGCAFLLQPTHGWLLTHEATQQTAFLNTLPAQVLRLEAV